METSRVALVTLMCVVLSGERSTRRISAAEVKMRVRPGDDVTLVCGCVSGDSFDTVWFRNESRHHHAPLFLSAWNFSQNPSTHYELPANPCVRTHDLLIKSVTESDEGLYHCTRMNTETRNGAKVPVYHYGCAVFRLSLIEPVEPESTSSTASPPEPGCSVCWTLLISVCPVCVLVSSLLSSTCVYCLCSKTTTAKKSNRRQNQEGAKHDEVTYASLDPVGLGQEQLQKKERVRNPEFCTYSGIRAERV